MVVRHELIHSSSVHQDSYRRSSSILLLVSRGAIISPYSFEVEFCISSFFSAFQPFPFVVGYHLLILRYTHKTTTSLFFLLLILSTIPVNVSF